MATGVFAFIQAWNEFIFALVIMNRPENQTLPVWLQAFNEGAKGTDWGGVMAGSTLMAIPVIDLLPARPAPGRQRPHRRGGEGMSAAGDRRLAAACLLGSFDGHAGAGVAAPRGRATGSVACCCSPRTSSTTNRSPSCARSSADARADVVIAIDEEGGDVTRLDAARGSDTPCPAAFGFVDDVALTADASPTSAAESASSAST